MRLETAASLLLVAAVTLAATSAPVGANSGSPATFEGMGFLYEECANQWNHSRASAITPDGRAIAGPVRGSDGGDCLGEWTSVLWTPEGGMRELDPLRPVSADDLAGRIAGEFFKCTVHHKDRPVRSHQHQAFGHGIDDLFPIAIDFQFVHATAPV